MLGHTKALQVLNKEGHQQTSQAACKRLHALSKTSAVLKTKQQDVAVWVARIGQQVTADNNINNWHLVDIWS